MADVPGGNGPYGPYGALPDWATSDYQDYGHFYNTYWGLPDDNARNAFVSAGVSAHNARQDNEHQTDLAVGRLGEGYDTTKEAYDGWLNDPYRTEAMERMSAMTDPTYEMIGDQQQASYELTLAQQLATAQASAAGAARSRGVAGSGMSAGTQAMMQGQGAAGLTQLSGQIDIANAEARQRAVEGLGSMAGRYEGIDLGYQNLLGGIDQSIADAQLGLSYEPYDPWALYEMTESVERGRREDARADEELAIMREANEEDIWDILGNLGDAIGTGIPEFIRGAINPFNWFG